MFKNRFTCKICDRPMPPRVFPAHLKKSHDIKDPRVEKELEVFQARLIAKMSPEEVQAQVEKNDQEIKELTITPHTIGNEEIKWMPKPFDWGEVYACNTCGEEYPAKAMPFHSWARHRV